MNQRERLIDLIVNAKKTDPERGSFTEYLADYLLSNGVIVSPVKVGDTVYLPSHERDNQSPDVLEETVTKVSMSGFWSSEDAALMQNDFQWEWDDLGKYVFVTCEEAEQALDEL